MKRILLISQYFNFIDQNSTAISINTRISGIENTHEITVFCFDNPKGNKNMVSNCKFKYYNMHEDVDIDEQLELFASEAIDYIKDNTDSFDLVMVHSNYWPTHKLVKQIKKNTTLKVIAYMPDPYVGGPMKNIDFQNYDKSVIAEKEAYEYADSVLVTNEFFKAYMENYYPHLNEKIHYVYHSFKEENYPVSDSFNLVFIGTLYLGRKINNFLIAFDELLTDYPEYKKFTFTSSVNHSNKLFNVINNLKNKENFIFINQRIPFEQAQKIELNSYAIVNIALPIPDCDVDPYFPTKLAQAFKTNKPIFSVSKNDGFTRKIMEQTDNYFAKDEVESIKKELKKLFDRDEKSGTKTEMFTVDKTSEEMLKIIKNI